MPSQWKFEILDSTKVTNLLLDLGAALRSCEEIEDIYYYVKPKSTKKIRIFQNSSVRLVQFDRDDTGAVSNLVRTDFLNLEEALKNIGSEVSEVVRLSKQVKLYFISDVEVGVHEFANGRVFVCLEGSDQMVKQIVELLSLPIEESIGLSFDEIFLN